MIILLLNKFYHIDFFGMTTKEIKSFMDLHIELNKPKEETESEVENAKSSSTG